MGELGELLRSTREGKGLTLAEVREATKIRENYLRALEEEDYDALPGQVYVRGFLRSYALALGLEPDDVLALYGHPKPAKGRAQPSAMQPLEEPLFRASSRGGPIGLVIGLLLVGLLVAAGWFGYDQFRGRLRALSMPGPTLSVSLPTETPLVVEPAPTSTPTYTQAPLSPTHTAVVLATSDDSSPTPLPTVIPSEVPPTVTPSRPPSSTPVPTRTPPTAPSRTLAPTQAPTRAPTHTEIPAPSPTPSLSPTPADVRLEVEATDRSWLRVTVDGEVSFEGILEAGQLENWIAVESILIRCGNAGGLVVKVNGEFIGALGESGEIVTREWTVR